MESTQPHQSNDLNSAFQPQVKGSEASKEAVRRSRAEAKQRLKGAVQQNALTKKQGVLEKLFCVWFDGMVYNQIWEDPVVDAKALRLGPDSKILTISSGGCNLLNYLAYDPASIAAVDLNPNHMNLARLRIAAVKYLPSYEDLLSFFGSANSERNIALYTKYIREHLPDTERQYWESPSLLRPTTPKRIQYFSRNLYNYSRSGYFIRFLHILCKAAGCSPEKLLSARTLEEQAQLFERYLAPTFNNWVVKSLGKIPVMLYSLGIPPQQFQALKDDDKSIIDLYRNRVRRLACNFPIQENYFAWQAFARKYNLSHQEGLPLYLQQKNYNAIKARIDRISTSIMTTTQFIQAAEVGSLNCFVFLDSQDWMSKEQVRSQWEAISLTAEPGSRIIFRTAGKESPIEKALPPELLSQFHYERAESEELYEQDRSAVYGGFHLYVFNGAL